jgi:hypothetical protein
MYVYVLSANEGRTAAGDAKIDLQVCMLYDVLYIISVHNIY